jgi:hypothetical protein
VLALSYWFLLTLIAAADIRWHRIPKALNFALIAVVALADFRYIPWIFMTWIFYCLLFRVAKGAIGYGDVRLSPTLVYACGAPPVGISQFVLPHLSLWTCAGIYVLIRRNGAKEALALAPFFVVVTAILSASSLYSLR